MTHATTNKVYVMDIIKNAKCPNCGSNAWIVDSSGPPDWKYWLLCLDTLNKGCVQTAPLPENIAVENE